MDAFFRNGIGICIGVGISVGIGVGGGACTSREAPPEETVIDPNLMPAPIVDGKPQFRIRDLKLGTGKEAKVGSRLKVRYTGWIFDLDKDDRRGKQFVSTQEGKPFTFQWGQGSVVRGWEQGLYGFQVGGVRELTLPPEMAFGEAGDPGKVPPNTAVVYELELLDVKDPPPAPRQNSMKPKKP